MILCFFEFEVDLDNAKSIPEYDIILKVERGNRFLSTIYCSSC